MDNAQPLWVKKETHQKAKILAAKRRTTMANLIDGLVSEDADEPRSN